MLDILTLRRLNEGPFVVGFLEAALWAETTDAGTSFSDAGYGLASVSNDAVAKIRADCEDFQQLAADDLAAAQAAGQSLQSLGADFYFTRQGHGVGYWDRGLGDLGQKLTELCRPYGSADFYLSDNDEVEVQ